MQHTEDTVWDAITESAKTRFEYREFESIFSETGSSHITDNVLFMTIAGHAAEHSSEEIVASINGELVLLGLRFPEADLLRFVEARKADLVRESLATKIAMILFQEGAEPPGVLVQVRRILDT